jgi:DNA (cytosine-5)-methyltransferase 1
MKAIDLFAGLGGFTLGAKQAGYRVVWAANHWKLAYDIHKANHPETEHACQDLRQADWSKLPNFDVLLASPSCKGHTWARGKDKPHHDSERATAWAVVDCAEFHRPEVIVNENVVEFLDWILFPAWTAALEALGYAVAPHIVDAADFGVPQNRERVFVICTRSKAPIQLKLPKRPHVAARSIIDWNAGQWSRVRRRGRAARTLLCFRNGPGAVRRALPNSLLQIRADRAVFGPAARHRHDRGKVRRGRRRPNADAVSGGVPARDGVPG